MKIGRLFPLGTCLLFLGTVFHLNLQAQAVVSVTNGPWNNTSTWSLPIIPTAANTSSITINHNVTIPSGFAVTIDGTIVNDTLTISGSLAVAASTGSLVVNGVVVGQNTSSFAGTNGSNVVFNSGSTYQHAFTTLQGSIPLAQWDTNSTVLVSGYTTGKTLTSAGNWTQNFGRFVYQCSGQSGQIGFSGLLTSVKGDLTISNTGASQLSFGSTQSFTLAIGGSLNIAGSARIVATSTGSPVTINIVNDFNFTSTNSGGSVTSTNGQPVFNVGRDFLMNAPGGLLRIGYIASSGGATFNVGRNFSVTAGALSQSSGVGAINFNNSRSHTFSNTGNIQNLIDYSVAALDTLIISNGSRVTGGLNSSLDLSGLLVLKSTDANGALQSGYGTGASGDGNVWVQNRTYETGSIISYGGSAAQVIGNGHPTNVDVITQINNSAGVSLNNTSSQVTLGILQLKSGILTAVTDGLTVQDLVTQGGSLNFGPTNSHALTINRNLQLTSGNIAFTSGATTADFVMNGNILAGPGTVIFSGANNRLTIGGTGAFTADFPLSGASSIRTINITRGGGGTLGFSQDVSATDVTINSGDLAMHSSKKLTIANNLNIASGSMLLFPGGTLELQKQFNNTLSGGVLSSDATSMLNITGTGTLGTLAFSGTGNTLNTMLLNRATAGTLVTLNSALTITSTLNLTDGVILNTSGLNFSSGVTINQTANAGFASGSAAPTGGPYNIIYGNGISPAVASINTTAETLGSVHNVTVNTTGTTTLATAMTVQGTLFLNSGAFANSTTKLNMSSGATIARKSTASFSGSTPTGGPYNIVYSGATLTTQNEAKGSINNFTTNATGTVTTSFLITVPDSVIVNSGVLSISANTLTMGNLATFVRHSGATVSGTAPKGGPYNLVYIGTSLSTALEITGSINNVSSNLTGTATLSNPLTTLGTLFVNSGDWASGTNATSIGALSNSATYDAPTTTLTLTGNITNNGIFNHNNGTVIFNGVSIMTGSVTPSFFNVQLNPGKTVTFPTSLNIAGNIVFAAGSTFNHASGTVILNGSGGQTIDGQGAQFYAITVGKGGGSVTLLSALPLANVLSINSATAFASNGFLTVLSQPNGSGDDTGNDASIGPITAGGSVTGSVIVQRFMKAKGVGNRYISAAVQGVGIADLSDDFTVMPGSIRFYNEAVRGTIDKGYTNISSATLPLQVGRGYLAYMYNNVDVLWDVTGTINAGTISLPVTFTNAPNPDSNADGWNLAGNPYPSAITWNNTPGTWSRTNVDPVITVYDISGTASYTYNYTNGSGNLPNGMIAMGQSFWVHLTAVGSLTVNEPAKISAAGGKFFRTQQAAPDQLTMALSNKQFRDNSFLVIDSKATEGYDPLYDGFKCDNELLSIYFRDVDGRHLAMNATNALPTDVKLPVEVNVSQPGEYSIDFTSSTNFPYSGSLYLIDRVEGKSMPVTSKTGYAFSVGNPGIIKDRFYLSTNSEVEEIPISESFVIFPNPVVTDFTIQTGVQEPVRVEIYNSLGQIVLSTTVSESAIVNTTEWSKGMYIVKGRYARGAAARRIIKQ